LLPTVRCGPMRHRKKAGVRSSIRGMPFVHQLGHTMDWSRAFGSPQPLKRFLETMHSVSPLSGFTFP